MELLHFYFLTLHTCKESGILQNCIKKTPTFVCVCVCVRVRLIGRFVLLFLYFFMPSNLSTCQNWNDCTVLTLTKSKEKLLEVLRQYYTSVKRPILSKGWGFKLSQHLNSCWLKKKIDWCRYQDAEGTNRLCSLFPPCLWIWLSVFKISSDLAQLCNLGWNCSENT